MTPDQEVRRPGFIARLRQRRRRGAAGLLSVMFLAVVATTLAMAITLFDSHKAGWDRWRMGGQIWAEWVHVLALAPRPIPAGWGGDWKDVRDLYCPTSLCSASDRTTATALMPASALGADDARNFGIAISDLSMHFSYIEIPPSPDLTCPTPTPTEYSCDRVGAAMFRPRSLGRLDAVRRGAVDGGLGTLAVAGSGGALRGPEAITAFANDLAGDLPPSWGGFQEGDVVALVHVSIPYDARALHRAPPSGRPDLGRMQADLDMGGNDLTVEGEALEADAATLGTGDVEVKYQPPTPPGAAVRADSADIRTLILDAANLKKPHEIGGGSRAAAEDETLRITGGFYPGESFHFESLETACRDMGTAPNRASACAASANLKAPGSGSLNTDGKMDVSRETGTAATPGSGVITDTMHAGTLTIESGECHGCQAF